MVGLELGSRAKQIAVNSTENADTSVAICILVLGRRICAIAIESGRAWQVGLGCGRFCMPHLLQYVSRSVFSFRL